MTDSVSVSEVALATFIFEHHACDDPTTGKPKVDAEAIAPIGGEDNAAAALRLLRLAHKRGAFEPDRRDVETLRRSLDAHHEELRALAEYLLTEHVHGDVDPSAKAKLDGSDGENTLAAALRLLRLAHARGAFTPAQIDLADPGHYKDRMHSENLPIHVLLFSLLLHEAACAAASAESREAVRVAYADLGDDARQEYIDTAKNLLAVIEPWCPAAGCMPLADAVDWLARHLAAAAVNDNDNRPSFDDMSPSAQAFRRNQATYLLARLGFRNATPVAPA